MPYLPTIGLEIHAELKTKTKMFCGCAHETMDAKPNTNICPVCAGHPGTLPTINSDAVKKVIMVGLAIGGDIARKTKFDRKNYFYPDLPKGYQISQYDEPLVQHGNLKGVRITRIHLEEDAGRLAHADSSNSSSTLVDYNRAGVPLMELVTEPEIHDGKTAIAFARELQMILRYLGASDADMEKGQMRIEANISVRKKESDPLGTKVEVKNLNSFRAVLDAIEYELGRQEQMLEKGEKIIQETRGWDEKKHKTIPQRSKENAHEYRYFPEPDLPTITLDESAIDVAHLGAHLPELPDEKRKRWMAEFGFSASQIEELIGDYHEAEYIEETISEIKAETKAKNIIALVYNYFTSDVRGLLIEQKMDVSKIKMTPERFADLIVLIGNGKISSRSAKDILRRMCLEGIDAHDVVREEGLEQISNEGELEKNVAQIIEMNPNAVADYKKGKTAAVQFLVGKSMAALRGRGNPAMLQEVIKRLLQ